MFTDLDLGREMIKEYHGKLPDDSPGRKLFVTVLQTSAWPFAMPKNTINLPQDVRAAFISPSFVCGADLTRFT